MKRRDDDSLEFASGRVIAPTDYICLSWKGDYAATGTDINYYPYFMGFNGGDYKKLTTEERIELAAYMVEQWRQFGAQEGR